MKSKILKFLTLATAFCGMTTWGAIETQEAFVAAVNAASSGDTIELAEGTFNLNGIAVNDGRSMTFVGQGASKTTLKYGNAYVAGASDGGGVGCYSFQGSGQINIQRVTLEDHYGTRSGATPQNSSGFAYAGGMSFTDCVFASTIGSFGGGDVVFSGCTFNGGDSQAYNVILYKGKSFTFDGCTFNAQKGAIQAFRDANRDSQKTLVVNSCSFKKGTTTTKTPIYFYDNTGNGGVWSINITGENVNIDDSFENNSTSGDWIWGSTSGSSAVTTVTKGGTYDSITHEVTGGQTVWAEGAKVEAAAPAVAKIGTTEFADLAEAIEAAKSGEIVEIVAAGNYVFPDVSKQITIKAAKVNDQYIDVAATLKASGCVGKFEGVTFEGISFPMGNNNNYHGFNHNTHGPVTFNYCKIDKRLSTYGTMTFNYCEFTQDAADYCITTYGPYAPGDVLTFSHCTFTSPGKFLNVYSEGNNPLYTINISDCTFENTRETAYKVPVLIKEYADSMLHNYQVNLSGSNSLVGAFPSDISYDDSVTAFGDGGLWAVEGTNPSSDTVKVFVDNVKGYPLHYVAQIGETKYESLQEAINAATAGQTVVLLADIATDVSTKVDKTLTIDLNGHTLDRTAASSGSSHYYGTAIYSSTANITLTVIDGSAEKTGLLKSYHYGIMMDGGSLVVDGIAIQSGDKHGIYMDGGNTDGSLTAKNCTITGEGSDAIGVYNARNHLVRNCVITTQDARYSTITKEGTGTLTFDGGSLTANNCGILVSKGKLIVESGTITSAQEAAISTQGMYDGSVEIRGGTIVGSGTDSFGVYFPSSGTLTITGGTITGKTGVAVKGGTVTVSGDATITGTGSAASSANPGTSGANNTGDALYIEANYGLSDGRRHDISVNISGGTFVSEHGSTVAARFKATTSHEIPTISISGGTFTAASDKPALLTGNEFDGTIAVSGGMFNVKVPEQFCAEDYVPSEALGNGLYTVVVDTPNTLIAIVDDSTSMVVTIPEVVIYGKYGAAEDDTNEDTVTKQNDYINNTTEANGLKVWQNYVMGVDGSVEGNQLLTDYVVGGGEGPGEWITVKTPIAEFNPPADSGITVKYVLKSTTTPEDAESWVAVGEPKDTPSFPVNIAGQEGDTYWKIEAVFSGEAANE